MGLVVLQWRLIQFWSRYTCSEGRELNLLDVEKLLSFCRPLSFPRLKIRSLCNAMIVVAYHHLLEAEYTEHNKERTCQKKIILGWLKYKDYKL